MAISRPACSPFVRGKTTLWIGTKLRNGLSLLRLVEHTNHLEANFFNKVAAASAVAESHKVMVDEARNNMFDEARNNMFAFAKATGDGRLRKEILGACEKVINSLQDEGSRGEPKARPVLDSLGRYAATWC